MGLKFSSEQEYQDWLSRLPNDKEIGKQGGTAPTVDTNDAPAKKKLTVNPRKVSTVNMKIVQRRIDEQDVNNDKTFQATLAEDFALIEKNADKRIKLQSAIANKQLDVLEDQLSESQTSSAVLEQLRKISSDESRENVKTNKEIIEKLKKTLDVEKELLKKNKGTMTKDDLKVLSKAIEQAEHYQQYVPDESQEVMHKARAFTPSSYMAGRKYREAMAEFEKKAKEEGREVTSKEKRQAMMAGASGGMKEAAGIKQDEKLTSKKGMKGMASAGLGAAMHGAGAYFKMPLLNIMAFGWNQRRKRIAEAERQYEKQQQDLKDSADLSYAQGILNTKGAGGTQMKPSSQAPVMSTVPQSIPAGGTSADNLQELRDDSAQRADDAYKQEIIQAIGRVELAIHELGGKLDKQPKETAKIARKEAKGEGKPQGIQQPAMGAPTTAKNEKEGGVTGIPLLDNLLGNAIGKKFPGLAKVFGMGGSAVGGSGAAGAAGAAGAGGAAAGGLGALLTGGAGAAFASSPALVAALVAAAGAGGYGIGTVLNKGLDWGTQKITGDKNATLGGKFYDWMHGSDTATMFETGQKDPKKAAATISSGAGDYGGKSYGSYQLSSKQGQVNAFLKSSGYGNQFQGMQVGSKEFDNKWKQLAANDENFASAQKKYAIESKAMPQLQQLKKKGFNLDTRGKAVQEMVLSTANQYGANTSVIQKALEQAAAQGEDVSKLTDAQLIKRVQDYKAANVETNFKSSSKSVRAGVARRIQDEKGVLLAMANQEAKNGQPTAQGTPAPAVNTAMAETPKGEKKKSKIKGKGKGARDNAPIPQTEEVASAQKASGVDQVKQGTKEAYDKSDTNLMAEVKNAKKEKLEEKIAQANGGGSTTTKSDRGGGKSTSQAPSSMPPVTTGDGSFASLLYMNYQRS